MAAIPNNELKHIEELIHRHTARLRVLELQMAQHGSTVLPQIITEHSDIEQQL
jgi:hypothetical protein